MSAPLDRRPADLERRRSPGRRRRAPTATYDVAGVDDRPARRPRARRARSPGRCGSPGPTAGSSPTPGSTPSLAGECARCLRPLTTPIDIAARGGVPADDRPRDAADPLDIGAEPEALRLTDHHELDLEPPVRDAISLAEPIAPLDRPDCPGLCAVCGLPLDEGEHDHPDDDIDPRLEALRALPTPE